MTKTISVSLSSSSIGESIKAVQAYAAELERKEALFVKRLADVGLNVAKMRFSSAAYAGTNDVQCRVEADGSKATIYADGSAVGFIEFGTGVSHPAYSANVEYKPPAHGTYGQGKGKRKKWGYYGDPGNAGVVKTTTNGREIVITSGNDPAYAMAGAIQMMTEKVTTIAREVFGS